MAVRCRCDLYNCSFGLAFFVYRNLISWLLVAALRVFMLCLLLSLILIVKYFSVRRFSLQDLFYHMDAVVLCRRLLMFLNSCISLTICHL